MQEIDILLASYNGKDYLEAQLKSILSQDYTNWKLLISDDCSSDGTLDIIRKYESIDSRIKLISSKKKYGSAKSNFLNLLNYSKASYIAFCDQDDVWHSDKLSTEYAALRNLEKRYGNNKPCIVYSDLRVVDWQLNIINDSYYKLMKIDPLQNSLNRILVQNVVTGCSSMINRSLVTFCRHLKEINQIVMHDWLFAMIAAAFGHSYYINDALIDYRQHGDNSVGATSFSIIKWLSKGKNNIYSLQHSFKQAETFYTTYFDKLSKENKIIINKYIHIRKTNPLLRPYFLIKGNFVKSNLSRTLGQLIYVLFI